MEIEIDDRIINETPGRLVRAADDLISAMRKISQVMGFHEHGAHSRTIDSGPDVAIFHIALPSHLAYQFRNRLLKLGPFFFDISTNLLQPPALRIINFLL